MAAYDMNASNLAFIEELLEQWQTAPDSVPPEWRSTFEAWERDNASKMPASVAPASSSGEASTAEMVYKQSRVNSLLWAYRDIDYLHAQLNPLRGYVTPGMQSLRDSVGGDYRDLSLEEFNLSETDMDLEFKSGQYMEPKRGTLREIIRAAKDRKSVV